MPLPGTPANAVPRGDAALVRRIEDIERRMREMEAASVSGIVGDLSATVSGLAQVVDRQVFISGDSATSGTVTLTTTAAAYASVTFTVPAGYTRALVSGWSSLYAGGLVASVIRTRIDGSNGPDMYAFTNAAYANAAASHTRTLTGLVGSGTFSVSTWANTSTGSTSAVIITTASAVFLR